MDLNQIKAPISSHLDSFEDFFKSSMKTNVPLLNKITYYLVKRKGKQLRPMFVFFTADLCGSISDSTYRASSLIELLHTATLVHDDVVDDSNQRRGFFSLNALWKNKIAVLVGDFLLSRGLILAVDNNDFDLLKIVTESVREMSEGELLQIEKARSLDIEEKVYFEIIRKKTASLIASCCACGAASVKSDLETINKMKLFGEKIGIAFQIKDDLFDYESNLKLGKPVGIDIKERKMTLPLIYLINNSDLYNKRKIINIIKNHNKDNNKVKELITMVKNSGGIEYTKSKMLQYQNEAFEILSTFPDKPAKTSLKELVLYTTERTK